MPSALLVALAFAAPGAAADWALEPRTASCTPGHFQTLEVTLPNILLHQLETIPSEEGAVAVRYLTEHPGMKLALSFVDKDLADYWRRPHDDQPDVLMAYSRTDRTLKIAHRVLHLDGRDEEAFIRDRAAQRDLAFAVADSFVHEISHARERERQGIPHLIEDELVSFYRSIVFVLDAVRAVPEFNRLKEALALQRRVHGLREEARASTSEDRRAKAKRELRSLRQSYELLVTPPRLFVLEELSALSRSTGEFENLVTDAYRRDGLPSLWTTPQVRLRFERAQLKEYQALMDRIATLEAQMGRPPSDPTSGEATKRLLREDIAFWGDLDRIRETRDRYAGLLAKLKSQLDRRRKAGELKAFAVELKTVEVRYGRTTFE